MTEVPRVGLIYSAIPAIIREVKAVGKTELNKQQGYKYRSADAICDALHDALGRHKVFTTCDIVSREVQERASSKTGNVLLYINLKCRYLFHAEDGSSVYTESWGEAMDAGDKATNKAMTAAYKYALLQVFCLMGHEDSETDSPEIKPAKQQKPPPVTQLSAADAKYIAEATEEINAATSVDQLTALGQMIGEQSEAVKVALRGLYRAKLALLETAIPV